MTSGLNDTNFLTQCRTASATYLPTYSYLAPREHSNSLQPGHAGSAFHPHELSSSERYSPHVRNLLAEQSLATMSNMSSATSANSAMRGSGVTDTQLQNGLFGTTFGAANTVEPAPPTYEYARAHPEQAPEIHQPIAT